MKGAEHRSCTSKVARTSSIWTVCVEEAGSRVAHWRKKADRKPGVMHVELATFEPSADGHRYCLVAAVTVEIDKESKLLPIFVPMPKRTLSADLQQLKKLSHCVTTTTCTRSLDLELSAYKRTTGENSIISSSRTFALTRTSHYPSHLLISPR